MFWKLSKTVIYLVTITTGRRRRRMSTSLSSSSSSRRHSSLLIVDTDVGFDDLLAIHSISATLRQQENQQKNLLLSTVGGIVDASQGASTLQQLFPQHAIAAGRNSPLIYYNNDAPLPPWLDHYRSHALNAFLNKMTTCPEETTKTTSTSDRSSSSSPTTTTNADVALSKIMSQLEDASDNSVDILCIGPLTNLAHWLDHDPELLASKLHSIYILGGNNPKNKQQEEPPEFNFSLDPEAAHTVLAKSSSIREKIHLVTTRGVCDMAQLTKALGKQRVDEFIGKMKTRNVDDEPNTFIRTLLHFDEGAFCLSFDPVCAFLIMMMPKQNNNDNTSLSASWEHMSVEVDPSSGLVVLSSTKEEDKYKINIATKVDLEGYLKWMNDIIS